MAPHPGHFIGLSILYALVHGLLPTGGTSVLPASFLVQQGLLPVVFILYGILWFGLLTVVFVLIEGALSGRRIVKGLSFDLFYFTLVVASYFEPLPHSGDIANEMSWMLADGLPLILLGIIMGRYLGHDATKAERAVTDAKRSVGLVDVLAVMIIPIFFMKGRLLSYSVLGIYSSFDTDPLSSLLWALAFGLVLGIPYYFFRDSMPGRTHRMKALFFGFVMFGIDLFLFNFAFALIVQMELGPMGGLTFIDLIVRVLADIIFVVIAISLYERVTAGRRAVIEGTAGTPPRSS